MRFLKRIRSRPKIGNPAAQVYGSDQPSASHNSHPPPATRASPRHNDGANAADPATLPQPVLETIFGFICPHAFDETYLSAEDSLPEDRCMLCDMRDLAQMALVCTKWNDVAQSVLYVLSF